MKKINLFNKYTLLLFFTIFFGIIYLVYTEPYESIFLMIFSFLCILIIKHREKIWLKMSLFNLLFIIILSYVISVVFIFSRAYNMNLSVSRMDKDSEKKAVLLIYEGESEMYSYKKNIVNIRKKEGIKEKIFLPYYTWSSKRYYQNIGKSNYKNNTNIMKDKLKSILSEEFEVFVAYLYDTVYVEEALVNIANNGYKDVIIVPVFISNGQNLKMLRTRVERMKLYKLNINVKYTDPLWDSENIVNSYINLIRNNIDDENDDSIGIMLIGKEGRSLNQDKNLKAIRENMMFRNRIKLKLLDEFGIKDNKVKLSWFKHYNPNYEDTLRELLDYSLGKIIIIITEPSVTNIENNVVLKNIVSNVIIPEGVKITIIDGFLQDSLFLEELKNRIEFTNLQKWE